MIDDHVPPPLRACDFRSLESLRAYSLVLALAFLPFSDSEERREYLFSSIYTDLSPSLGREFSALSSLLRPFLA